MSGLKYFNTGVSYTLRCVVVVHLASLGMLLRMRGLVQDFSASLIATGLLIGFGIIFALAIIDWATSGDPNRGHSKIIDTVLAIISFLAMGTVVLYSLSMGTL